MNIIYLLKFGDEFCEKHNELARSLSEERRLEIEQYRNVKDKLSHLYSELLVRHYAVKLLGIKNEEILFGKSENGKPYILKHEDFCYNVSHTKNVVVLAVSDSNVGVDAEYINRLTSKKAALKFTVPEQEYAAVNTHNFIEIWTKKEAYIKCFGGSFSSIPMNSFNVLDKSVKENFKIFEIDDLLISIYNEAPTKQYELKMLNEEQFLKMI